MAMMIEKLRTAVEALGLAPSSKSRQLAEALTQEAETERLARRQAQADERVAVAAAQLARVQAHQPQREAALAAIARKRADVEDAIQALQELERTERLAMGPLDARHDALTRALATTASPRLEAIVRELREEWRAMASQRDDVNEKTIDGGSRRMWTNVASITARAVAIRAAIEVVEALAYEPLTDPEIDTRVEALRAALPGVESRPEKYTFRGAP